MISSLPQIAGAPDRRARRQIVGNIHRLCRKYSFALDFSTNERSDLGASLSCLASSLFASSDSLNLPLDIPVISADFSCPAPHVPT